MTVSYQIESWDSYYADPARERLWSEHFAELAQAHEWKMETEPDVVVYRAMDAQGMLNIMVARKDGAMIGYCLIMFKRHLHYAALCAFEDSYFVTRSERKGFVGYKLIKQSLLAAKRRGAKRGYFMTKHFASVASLFVRMGMEKSDETFTIWLEDL
jgi:hypothetical protein